MGDSTAQPKQIGIYNLNMEARGGGEKLTLVLASHLSGTHIVQVFHNTQLDIDALEKTFAVDLSRVKFTKLTPPNLPLRMLAKIRGAVTSPFSLPHYRQLNRFNLDLFLNVSYGSALPCPAAKGIFICMFPHRHRREDVHAGLLGYLRCRFVDVIESRFTGAQEGVWLDSYTRVIAISKYSAEWIGRLWRIESEVVYPPADDMGPPTTKERIILHVGRFTPAGVYHHHKAQDVLLAAFKKMRQLHRDGWALHFTGNINSDPESNHFARELVQGAKGFPVEFHFNASFDELRTLYRRAAIYWHATGVGRDPEEHPELHEHFGITTVEAMSAGVVPIVIALGGQEEIVTNGVDGMCWNHISELVQQTARLATDSELRCALGNAAIESSQRFSRTAFTAHMDRSIAQLLND